MPPLFEDSTFLLQNLARFIENGAPLERSAARFSPLSVVRAFSLLLLVVSRDQ